MERLTTTPFGRRPVSAGQIPTHDSAVSSTPIDKWKLFALLRTGHDAFGVSYRSLSVLNALLSFLPSRTLSDNESLVVFPSNNSLSQRAHGMPESTLRRHLTALIDAGLISRHDSPNGKRYAARTRAGDFLHAFGFDLGPLLARSREIAQAAHAALELAERHRRLRERFTLMKRDAIRLSEHAIDRQIPGDWDAVTSHLAALQKRQRRKLPLHLLEEIEKEMSEVLGYVTACIDEATTKTSACDAQNERHLQRSEEEFFDKESPSKPEGNEPTVGVPADTGITLESVLDVCPEARSYAPDSIRSWQGLIELAQKLGTFVGISGTVWRSAVKVLGPKGASIVVCCMIERMDEIRNPGGYLRTLCRKASRGGFSIGRMMAALRPCIS